MGRRDAVVCLYEQIQGTVGTFPQMRNNSRWRPSVALTSRSPGRAIRHLLVVCCIALLFTMVSNYRIAGRKTAATSDPPEQQQLLCLDGGPLDLRVSIAGISSRTTLEIAKFEASDFGHTDK